MRLPGLLLLVAIPWPAMAASALEGTVTNSVTGAPVRKALVILRKERSGYQALTDAAGHFRIDNVAPGSYDLWAEAQGYVRRVPSPGSGPVPSMSVTLAEGQELRDRTITLIPFGVISGKVTDENGEPVIEARVEALEYEFRAFGKNLRSRGNALTDDRGEYRLFELPPGHYSLRVKPKIADAPAKGRVHSAVPEEGYAAMEPVRLEVAAGAEQRGIDLRLRKTRVYHLRGKVVGVDGQPVAKAQVTVTGLGYVETKPDGTFDMRGIAPGSYTVWAYWRRPVGQIADEISQSRTQEVIVGDRDADGLTFRLEPSLSVRGSATADGFPIEKLQGTRVHLQGTEDTVTSRVQADGTFTLQNVIPQEYHVMVDRESTAPYVKAIRFGDQDVSADGRINVVPGAGPLAIVFGNDPGRVDVTVRSAGAATAPLCVTVAPEGRFASRADLVQTVDPEDDGSFILEGLAPGSYKVFAWELWEPSVAAYPDFRNALESKAVSVEVRAGEKKSVQVTAITEAEVEEALNRLR